MEQGPLRKKRGGRCEGCGLHLHLCMCSEFPLVEVAAELLVVQHIGERFKPTNTGRLLARMVDGASLTYFGMREPPFDTTALARPDVSWHVVFPRDDAPVLDSERLATMRREAGSERRIGFVFLDGTWHQCSRMSRRVPMVKDLPCVALPDGPPSRWGVRTQHDVRGLSTFEAGVRLVSLLEGRATATPLQNVFHEIAARLLFMKGKLRKPEVPAEWRNDALPDPASA
ncbi:MAG: tRNA-uridine aminocarboxypropyltransferase [Myxococcota bacterium]